MILMEWVKSIQLELAVSKGYRRPMARISLDPDYWKYFRIGVNEIEMNGKTGDLILFKSNDCWSKLLRTFTCSETDHVGIMVEYKYYDHNKLYFLESLSTSGVKLTEWSKYATDKNNFISSMMFYRSIDYCATDENLENIYKFIDVFLLEYRAF